MLNTGFKDIVYIVEAPLFIFFTLMSVLHDDVQMDHSTARNTKDLKFMWSQDIYNWISPLNKQSGWPFILTQQSMGRIEWYFWSLAHFRFLKHLMVFLRYLKRNSTTGLT